RRGEDEEDIEPKSLPPKRKNLTHLTKNNGLVARFLEQWHWLESQCPPDNQQKHRQQQQTGGREGEPGPRSSESVTTNLPISQSVVSSVRAPNLWESSIDRVPSINTKQLKSLKSCSEQLENCKTGLDLWSKASIEDLESGVFTPVSATHNNHHHHLEAFNESAEAYPRFPIEGSTFIQSSPDISTLPLSRRSQTLQVRDRREDFLKIVEQDRSQVENGKKPAGIVVNKFMEVNNLPYPGLYPHSAHYSSHHQQFNHTPNIFTNKIRRGSQDSPPALSNQLGRKSSIATRKSSLGSRLNEPGLAIPVDSSKLNDNLNQQLYRQRTNYELHGPRGPRPDLRKDMNEGDSDAAQDAAFLGGSTPPFETFIKLSSPTKLKKSLRSKSQQRMSFAYGSSSNQLKISDPIPLTSAFQAIRSVEPLTPRQIDSPISASSCKKFSTPSPFSKKHYHRQGLERDHNFCNAGEDDQRTRSEEDGQRCNKFLDEVPGESVNKAERESEVLRNENNNYYEKNERSVIGGGGDVKKVVVNVLDEKVRKLGDMLPEADPKLLRKILISENYDEVSTIGAYLDLKRNV
ncbi:hypothetical protein BY996DRAFT_8218263, partial [Phakopsora pachyrhizi]